MSNKKQAKIFLKKKMTKKKISKVTQSFSIK